MQTSQPVATMIAATIAGAVAALGWFVTKFLDRRQKRAEFRRAYIQQQIEEFYGPIHGLLSQILAANHLKHRIFEKCQLDDEAKTKTDRYFEEKYFLPLHARLREIVESKLYLVEGVAMPESLWRYLEHSLQEASQHALWFEYGVNTISLRGESFPNEIFRFIKETLDRLMIEYEVNVQELKTGYFAPTSVSNVPAEDQRNMA